MGTNYFIHEESCSHCGHQPALVHIGKSSHGWKFLFHATDECVTKQDWEHHLVGKQIVDEYNRFVTYAEFFEMVETKQPGIDHKTASFKQWGSFPPDNRWYLDAAGYYFYQGEFC
jgi:hypothetical protein